MVSAAIGTAIAATLLVAAVLFFTSPPSVVLANALAASRAKPWIHGTTTLSDGKGSRQMEFWISSQRGVSAVRHGEFLQLDDHQLKVSTKFVPTEGVIYRLPELELPGAVWQAHGDTNLLERILLHAGDAEAAFPKEKIVRSEKKDLTENAKPWIEYSFTLERRYEPLTKRNLVIRVDASSKLLHSCIVRHLAGPTSATVRLTSTTRFDFPETGPADIYALGAPRSAEIVDRVPRGDLARILAGMKTARRRFEDYDAIVVQHTEGHKTTYTRPMNLAVNRVRRCGDQLRVDALIAAKPKLQAPEPNADMSQWWNENRENFYSVPLQIYDGKTVYLYTMIDDVLPADRPPNTAVKLRSKQAMRLPVDDLPVRWPAHLVPEYYCRPFLWASDLKREITLDADPDDGPEDTVRLIVNLSAGPYDRPAGEHYRYWIDVDCDHALRKSVSKVFKRHSPELAYVDTVEFDDFAESPTGISYPTKVRCSTSASKGVQVTDFHLDFGAALPDELFQPVDVSSKE